MEWVSPNREREKNVLVQRNLIAKGHSYCNSYCKFLLQMDNKTYKVLCMSETARQSVHHIGGVLICRENAETFTV